MIGTIDYRNIQAEDLKGLSDKRVLRIYQTVRSMMYAATHNYENDDYDVFAESTKIVKAELDTRGHVER